MDEVVIEDTSDGAHRCLQLLPLVLLYPLVGWPMVLMDWVVSACMNFALVNCMALVMPMEGGARTLLKFITKSIVIGKF